MARELVRQALLIAGREELGLPTRDSSLEDKIDSKDMYVVEIQTTADAGGSVDYEVTLGKRWNSDWRHTGTVTFSPVDGLINYVELSEKLETLSRETFPGVLIDAGFKRGEVKTADAGAALDPSINELLEHYSPLSQIDAVRQTHLAERSQGETLDELDSLAAGYANLAMLTHRVWSTQPTAYGARALLYAQRLKAKTPGTARRYWRLAYVLDMIGADRFALEEIERGKAVAKESGEEEPGWIKLVEARCHYDPSAIRAWIKENGTSEYADLQLYRSMPSDWTFFDESGKVAVEFVERRHGGCVPITRHLANSSTIGHRHIGVPLSEQALRADIVEHVPHWQDMPALVKKAVDRDEPLVAVPEAMASVGLTIDPGEPSARTVGRLILELSMLSVRDELSFRWTMLATGYDDVVQRRWPAIRRHELGGLVYLALLTEGRSVEYMQKTYANRNFGEARLSLATVAHPLMGVIVDSRDLGMEVFEKGRFHADDLADDLLLITRLTTGPEKREAAKLWLAVCPDRASAEFQANRPGSDEPLPDMKLIDRWATNPETTNLAIALLLERHADDDAIRLLNEVIPSQGDEWQFKTLAELYWDRQEFDKWRSTQESLIRRPGLGIAPYQARADVAFYLMTQGEYEKAMPYAVKASESYSGKSLDALACCFEGLGKFDRAVNVHERSVERYEHALLGSYLAYIRMNKGDRQKLKEAILAEHEKYNRPGEPPFKPYELAVVAQIDGNAKEAAERWETLLGNQPGTDPYEAMMAAMLRAELNEPEEQRRLLRQAVDAKTPDGQANVALRETAQAILDDLENPGSLTDDKITKLGEGLHLADKVNVDYFAAWQLLQSGQTERAKARMESVAKLFPTGKWVATFAAQRLREMEQPKKDAKEEPAKP